MYAMAQDMVKTDPNDIAGFMRKWVALQKKISETLPLLPVYSNVYYDYYPDVLQDYAINSYITWSEAIVPAYLSDPPEAAEEEETEEEAETLVP